MEYKSTKYNTRGTRSNSNSSGAKSTNRISSSSNTRNSYSSRSSTKNKNLNRNNSASSSSSSNVTTSSRDHHTRRRLSFVDNVDNINTDLPSSSSHQESNVGSSFENADNSSIAQINSAKSSTPTSTSLNSSTTQQQINRNSISGQALPPLSLISNLQDTTTTTTRPSTPFSLRKQIALAVERSLECKLSFDNIIFRNLRNF